MIDIDTLCEHDMRIYADIIGGTLYHFRDNLGANQIDSAAEELLEIKEIMSSEGKAPHTLGVICGIENNMLIA